MRTEDTPISGHRLWCSELKSRTYEKEGQKHYETYIKVAEARFAGGNTNNSSDSPVAENDTILSDFEEILTEEMF